MMIPRWSIREHGQYISNDDPKHCYTMETGAHSVHMLRRDVNYHVQLSAGLILLLVQRSEHLNTRDLCRMGRNRSSTPIRKSQL